MKAKHIFPFKDKDVVSFPDTDSEFVDVGGDDCGAMMLKVAESVFQNLFIVRKYGRGFRLELEYNDLEVFSGKGKFVSLKQFLDYFGDYSELKYCCVEEDLRMNADDLENKYNL